MQEQRLQKVIAEHGVCSRRQAEQMIQEGRVRVNGNTATLGTKVLDGEDVIEIDGKRLGKEPPRVYLMLNKPRGYVTTLSDEQGRKNVAELVTGCGQRVYPVGRLDLSSEGLLLLTNDGEAANRLMHPSHEVDKVYLAWVGGFRDGADKALRGPLELDGYQLRPAGVVLKRRDADRALLEITIHEGRNRQVRRMCEQVGLKVTRLKRIAEGQLRLDRLEPGTWRLLTEAEVAYIRGL